MHLQGAKEDEARLGVIAILLFVVVVIIAGVVVVAKADDGGLLGDCQFQRGEEAGVADMMAKDQWRCSTMGTMR